MPNQVSMGAKLKCSFGAAPSVLVVLPLNRVFAEKPPAANIMDHQPLINILPFGTCNSLANPMVAAATAAALGVLTPMPCVPATTTPWVPGAPKTFIGKFPALDDISVCMCMYGGVVKVDDPFTRKTLIP